MTFFFLLYMLPSTISKFTLLTVDVLIQALTQCCVLHNILNVYVYAILILLMQKVHLPSLPTTYFIVWVFVSASLAWTWDLQMLHD